MGFQDDLIQVLAELPIDALERILNATERSDLAGDARRPWRLTSPTSSIG
jgi:hypothetical protein